MIDFKKNLLIIPYSTMTPMFLSDDFFGVLFHLLSIKDYDGIIFPFYIDGYTKKYAGVYIKGGKVACLFGEQFPSNVLSFKSNDKTINILLFPYIYSDKFRQKDLFNICLDDEAPLYKDIPSNYVFVSPQFDEQKDAENIFFDKCFQKECKICSQSLEKLLKYN